MRKAKTDKRIGIFGASLLALSSALVVSPALAQDTTVEEDEEEIIVTGSRIQRPALDSGVPITSVQAEELLSQGDLSIGDALNDLPALRSTFSQSNSTRFIGTAGLNLLDLRGLGTARTLTLVNGRRHVTASPGDYRVDVNTIPAELLERVDVVTGGSSAVYGSDAVAGVVNFVTRDDFEGFRAQAQTGVSNTGDRPQSFIGLTWGQNFAEGRGNLAAALEFSHQGGYLATERDDISGAFSGGFGFDSSPGPFDNEYYTNLHAQIVSDGLMVSAFPICNAGTAGDINACTPGSTAASFIPATYVFLPDGTLIRNPVQEDLQFFGSINSVGGLGSTFGNYGHLAPEVDRVSFNLLGHYDFSDLVTAFFEAKYARLEVYAESSPSFFQGRFSSFFGFPTAGDLRCDNPFLSLQAYTTLINIGRCPNIAYGSPSSTRFNTIGRNNVDWGVRAEDNERETMRFVGGLRGDFNDDWSYEISLNYGKFEGVTTSLNNLQLYDADGNPGPLFNALRAVRNGSGQIVCAINADLDLTNDDPACFPLNPFGEGNADPRALDYVMTESFYGQEAAQTNISAFVTGDSSQFFSLPGGPIRFAVGGEYRKEEASVETDELTRENATFLTAIQPVDYPDIEVDEIFAEFSFPILSDMPYADLLEFTAAGRRSSYNGATGDVDAYNFTGVYRPIEDIMFRAAYGRSVRAPTASDSFDPPGQNFAFIADPCDIFNIFDNPNRIVNCADPGPLGVPGAGTTFVNTPANAATASILQGGNPDLVAETSDSYTYGLVLQPRWLSGLSVTIDYYDITVDNLIAVLTAQQIVDNCYDAASLTNQFCDLIEPRQAGTGFFNDQNGPGNFALLTGPVNFAKQETSGYDVSVDYEHTFQNGDRLNTRLIWSYVDTKNNYLDPTNPDVPNRALSELGDPQYEWAFNAAYRRGIVTTSAGLRWIGRMTIDTYEAQNSFNGNPPTNPDSFPIVWYDDTLYVDLRIDIDFTDQITWYGGVDNLTDELPQFGTTGQGAGSGIWDNVGTYLYTGVRARF